MITLLTCHPYTKNSHRYLVYAERCKKTVEDKNEKFKDNMDNASSIKDRLETLKKLHENGIYTVLFMSPIFPYITEWNISG